ncbi:unnamed protein product [Meloidogyne enterolobii]|uniref:Uncharacterized protein n=1 Tax=Meloidogyne enterolobii TaxID=390850 RepID=A0ACB1AVX0_MELEN
MSHKGRRQELVAFLPRQEPRKSKSSGTPIIVYTFASSTRLGTVLGIVRFVASAGAGPRNEDSINEGRVRLRK